MTDDRVKRWLHDARAHLPERDVAAGKPMPERRSTTLRKRLAEKAKSRRNPR